MGYTLGQAAKAVGMSKTSILRSIKAGRISAGRDEFGQWAIEPCELHRVYPPLADDTGTGSVTGGETALAEASTRATLAEARLSDVKSMLDDIREQRDRWQQQAERLAALAITDQRKERSPAQPQSWRLGVPSSNLGAPTRQIKGLRHQKRAPLIRESVRGNAGGNSRQDLAPGMAGGLRV
jgi:hypothetical protein